jgi:hypothetical protein
MKLELDLPTPRDAFARLMQHIAAVGEEPRGRIRTDVRTWPETDSLHPGGVNRAPNSGSQIAAYHVDVRVLAVVDEVRDPADKPVAQHIQHPL